MAVGEVYSGVHEGRVVRFERVERGSNLFHLRSPRSDNVYALLVSGDDVSCSCRGWIGHQHCWHSRLLQKIRPIQYRSDDE